MVERVPPLRILAALFTLLVILAPGAPGLAQSDGPRSLRVQLHWDDEGAEVYSVQPSLEPSTDIAEIAADPRFRIAEHINADGFWVGQPISTLTGASVVHLPLGMEAAQLSVEHRRLGSTVLEVPQGDSSRPRGDAPELIAFRESGEPGLRQDWVFLGDGYQEDERSQFLADVESNLSYLEGIAPYSRYVGLVNVWALFLPSPESGADHREAAPPTYVDTALGCHYGAYGIDRLIDCDADAVLEASSFAPGEDVRIVLVNDPIYGGSGGSVFAAAYNGENMVQAVVHEMAHSDGALADEYSYEVSSDPPTWGTDFPNCGPSESDPQWAPWIEAGSKGVGAFPVCSYTDYFRPTENLCLMRELGDNFCVVCRESLTRTIYGHLYRLTLEGNENLLVLEANDEATLRVTTVEVLGEPLYVTWVWIQTEGDRTTEILLDEGPGLTELTLAWEDLAPGAQFVVARVEDRIDWMLSDPPEAMTDVRSFTLKVDGLPETGCQTCSQHGLPPSGQHPEVLLISLLLGLRRRRGGTTGSPGCRCAAVL